MRALKELEKEQFIENQAATDILNQEKYDDCEENTSIMSE